MINTQEPSGKPGQAPLVEAFDFSLGGGVAGAAVLLGDAGDGEVAFEGGASSAAAVASEAGGVDHAVVGEGGGGGSVLVAGLFEGGEHDGGGHGGVGGDVQDFAGVVIEPGDDFCVGAGGQAVVGDVGLPELVGLVGFEAVPGGAGFLVGFGSDLLVAGQDPVDGGS